MVVIDVKQKRDSQALQVALVVLVVLSLAVAATGQSITKLYVPVGPGGDAGHSSTLVYGVETGKLITELQPSDAASLAVANHDSSEVWLFAGGGSSCDVISTATDKVTRTIDVQCRALDAAFSPDGRYCFVAGSKAGDSGTGIIAVDCSNYSVVTSISDVINPTAVVVTGDSKSLFCVSPSQGTVTRMSLPDLKIVATISVGYEPTELSLTPDGRFLFVVCRGLSGGARGGSHIAILDTRTNAPFWVLDVGKGCTSAALTRDLSQMVVTYAVASPRASENVRIFKLSLNEDSVSISRSKGFVLGQTPLGGMIVSSGRYWIGCDPIAGGVPCIDLAADTAITTYSSLGHPRPLQVAAVTVNIASSISAINSRIAAEQDSSRMAEDYLDLAYLLRTAGRKNDMVVAYQKVIDQFPGSFAAISAGMQLAAICFDDLLYSQTAEYSFSALDSYARYLADSTAGQRLSENSILTALDRLALFSKQFDKDYLKKLAESFLRLTSGRPELAESYFRLGYHLRQTDQSKLANRLFVKVQDQLADISDPGVKSSLAARLALATADPKVTYRIKEKKDWVIDGNLSKWAKDKPLLFSVNSGFLYGTANRRDDDDLSGSIYFGRTETDLLIAGSIKDDSLVSIDDASGDMVAVFFDLRPNSGNYFTRDFAAGNGCFSLYIVAPTPANPKVRVQLGIQTAYEITSVRTATGYTFELRLPLSTFGGWLTKEVKRFGLGVELIDYDNPSDSKASKAIGFLIPSEGVGGPPRPELFGIAEF